MKMSDTIRILYIDDYELDRELVKDSLEKEHGGFEVTEASNRQEFEALLKNRKFDVVLSDFNIAGFQGLQVLEAVRAHEPRMPVIIVTGTGSEEIAVMALKQGAADYVIKRPKHIRKLPQTILAAIEKKMLRDQREKAEITLKESEERYRSILENVLVGIYQVTLDGTFVFSNQKMREMFGYSSQEEFEAVGNITNLYVRPEERERIVDDIIHKGFINQEIEFRHKEGQSIWVKLHTQKIKNTEGETILEGLMEDVTEIKTMEAKLQQAQKLEAIGTLAGGIAHDFNNILSSVIGFTELSIEDSPPGTPLHKNLTSVLMAGNRAKDLIKQIMTFSRKSQQKKKPIQINSLVMEATRMLRSTIPASIEITEHISKGMLTIDANASQMNQVVVNLVTNASHAIDDNGIIEIGVTAVNLDESTTKRYPDLLPGRYAEIFVSDNGCGITKDNLDRIFDPYFTTKDPEKGTGLGLSVIHGIVKIHGGHITVYSEVGRGTTFHVYLPLAEQPSQAEPIQKREQLPMGTERILFVDDEPSIAEMQKQLLERMGYTVASLTSSMEALEAFRKAPGAFDLIITDMTMPNMNGDRLFLSVKEIRPDIPVILCTGFSENINMKAAKDLQIDGFLMKPVDNEKMAETVRKVLDEAKKSVRSA